MFKFLRKHPVKDSEERQRLKKELFEFRKCVEHGFPSKPSALAYDQKLRLVGIGTKSGAIRIYGSPGVEFSGQHKNDVTVNQLFFLPSQGRLISLCSDNTLHMWEINIQDGMSELEELEELSMENNKQKAISTCCLSYNGEELYIGTEGGNIYMLDIKTFKLSDQIIYQDVVMQNVPDDFKVDPGAVEAIAIHPSNPEKILIGYNRGLIVLWDSNEGNAEKTFNASQQLDSVCWHRSGGQFMSAHADGSYIIWNVADCTSESPSIPYGPFPCKAISKIQWKTSKLEPFIIFSGGMPRASYGDKHTVSCMQEKNQKVFDFTSRVVDFVVLTRADECDTIDERSEHDEPHALVVLAEEELVVLDLESENWPAFRLPYLHSLHSSAITCSQHVSNVPDQLWQKILDAGESQMSYHSQRDWPVNGGRSSENNTSSKDLLLTGHEDGTVRFWDASGTSMKLLYKLGTSNIFSGDASSPDNNTVEEEEWPPFKKVGCFDPYSDDPRLGIQKIALCPLSETLAIAGTAGQIIILQMERDERMQEVNTVSIDIVSDRDGFVWKGHEALTTREGEIKFQSGFQPTSVMQLKPPAACTALSIHTEWQLVAAGTAHGLGLFDYAQKKEVMTKCTLNPNELTGTSETPMSRRKSLKKSLRESFRRLRKIRTDKRRKPKDEEKPKDAPAESTEVPSTSAAAASETTTTQEPSSTAVASASIEAKPVERQVEARGGEDSMGSMVRSVYFADTFILNGASNNPSLWVGTNGGHIFIYNITVPSGDKRHSEAISCVLAKEIKLKHRAPVLSMAVVDARTRVLPDPLEVQHERAKAPDMSGPHSVVICSEEQLKVFALPSLKPRYKFKLTALDGSRIRKVAFVNFRSRSDENYSEFDISCLSNMGDLSVYTVTILRQQLNAAAIKKENINGILSFIFTKDGQGFYLSSASEFTRVSLSARCNVEPKCSVDIAEGLRMELHFVKDEPEPVQENVEKEAPQTETEGERTAPADTSVISTDSQLNESQVADTTGDITVDTIIVAGETETPQVTEVTEPVQAALETVATTESTESSETVETSEITEVTRVVSGDQETITTRVISGTNPETVRTTVVTRTISTGETHTTENEINVDDDTKATKQSKVEVSPMLDKLGDMKITDMTETEVFKEKAVTEIITESVTKSEKVVEQSEHTTTKIELSKDDGAPVITTTVVTHQESVTNSGN